MNIFIDHETLPVRLLSYPPTHNDLQLFNKFSVTMHDSLKLNDLTTTAYYPHLRGQAGRFHIIIAFKLSPYFAKDQWELASFLQSLTWQSSLEIHRLTEIKPNSFQVCRNLRGREPFLILSISHSTSKPKIQLSHYFQELLQVLFPCVQKLKIICEKQSSNTNTNITVDWERL